MTSVELAGKYGAATRALIDAREDVIRWAETVCRLRKEEERARMAREDAEEALAYARGVADEAEETAEDVGGELLTALRAELEG